MTSAQIRQSFLDFFREKQHTIVSSSSLLPDAPNLLFTNAGMNQFVPIFLGQQKPSWNPPRVADTQKCIRAGGKHNDLEDVGLDTYHHTFFEMLGNWSFGDYFKKEAIEWAWELVVRRWGLPASRLYATVYKPGPGEPSEFDQEAHDHWVKLFREAELDPAIHIVNGSKADNFWMMGETGPCGPCSELHADLTPDGDTRGALVNKDDPRCFEIWNLVFIQFNANADGTFTPLPQRHVDTGMGFERVTAILQGTKNFTEFSGTISNYETDIFRPIFDELEKRSGKRYGSTLPGSAFVSSVSGGVSPPKTAARDAQQSARDGRSTRTQVDIAFRVIADHIRTLSFAIADGIIPSNEGRGYVLRRILRRAVRYGRTLGFHEPFFFKLVNVVAQTMGDVFPGVRAKQSIIVDTIRREEESFNKTVDAGIQQFENKVDKVRRSGDDALLERLTIRRTLFNKYRCQGLENRQVIAQDKLHELVASKPTSRESVFRILGRNQNLSPELNDMLWRDIAQQIRIHLGDLPDYVPPETVVDLFDTYGFPLDLIQLMARERGMAVDAAGFEELMKRQRERARAAQKKDVIEITNVHSYWGATRFVGYDHLVAEGGHYLLEDDRLYVEISPFYAEMGGQVGDTGWIEGTDGKKTNVLDTVRTAGGVHLLRIAEPEAFGPSEGIPFRQIVDADRRRKIQGHHTVTHILHWALHELVSRDATQKGSYVGPDKLTFDFLSAALTPQQKHGLEKLVNEKVGENAPVSWREIPYAEAKRRSDIQQFFGEKYGETVRVVQIGGQPNELNGYSMELCGGTHVHATGEIGSFRIVSEYAIAAGIRRIEAVAGNAARDWAQEQAAKQQEKFETFARKKSDIANLPAFSNHGETAEMLKQIDVRASHLEKVYADVRDWEKKHAKSTEADLKKRAVEIASELAGAHAGKSSIVESVTNSDAKLLQVVADTLKSKFSGPIFLAGEKDGNVALIAVVPKELTSKVEANKLIQEVAPIVGGKGGGRPEGAQGAGKDATKLKEALDRARELLK